MDGPSNILDYNRSQVHAASPTAASAYCSTIMTLGDG